MTALLRFARAQPEPPVLYPQTDAGVLFTSRYRDELRGAFRFILADAELIEQLVDKARFQLLAERYGLPVPPAQRLRPSRERAAPDLEVPFPVIVKPVQRGGDWTATGELGKALRVRTQDDWHAVWPRLASLRSELLVQRLVPGPESAMRASTRTSTQAVISRASSPGPRSARSHRTTATARRSRSSTCRTSRTWAATFSPRWTCAASRRWISSGTIAAACICSRSIRDSISGITPPRWQASTCRRSSIPISAGAPARRAGAPPAT